MEHVHAEHVAAHPDRVFEALANPETLAQFVPQLTSIRQGDGDRVEVEARYEGRTQRGEAYFRASERPMSSTPITTWRRRSTPSGASWRRRCSQRAQSATIVAASAIRWSFVQGGPIVARGPCRTASARSASRRSA